MGESGLQFWAAMCVPALCFVSTVMELLAAEMAAGLVPEMVAEFEVHLVFFGWYVTSPALPREG